VGLVLLRLLLLRRPSHRFSVVSIVARTCIAVVWIRRPSRRLVTRRIRSTFPRSIRSRGTLGRLAIRLIVILHRTDAADQVVATNQTFSLSVFVSGGASAIRIVIVMKAIVLIRRRRRRSSPGRRRRWCFGRRTFLPHVTVAVPCHVSTIITIVSIVAVHVTTASGSGGSVDRSIVVIQSIGTIQTSRRPCQRSTDGVVVVVKDKGISGAGG